MASEDYELKPYAPPKLRSRRIGDTKSEHLLDILYKLIVGCFESSIVLAGNVVSLCFLMILISLSIWRIFPNGFTQVVPSFIQYSDELSW